MDELASLIEKAGAGDLEAFGQVVRRFQDMAYGYAYSILGDVHLAEDAAQEAFVEAYRQLSQLREPAAFPGWFRRIVFKRCDRFIRQPRVETVPLDAVAGVAASDAGPSQITEQREMQEKVIEAIKALPEHQRTVATLFYINGYSHKEIASFLEEPVTTVKKRLHDSRTKLKERMLNMVTETLRENAPDERFSQKVIAQLRARPRLLEIEGHPVNVVWREIRAALSDFEVIASDEVEDKARFGAVQQDMDLVYHVNDQKALISQASIITFNAICSRVPPVRLLAASRIFRPEQEDARRSNVFHQADGICIEPGADIEALRSTCQRVVKAVLGSVEYRWVNSDYGFVDHGFELEVCLHSEWMNVMGCGILKYETLRNAGYDPSKVSGYAFGLGIERMAMLKLGIKDLHALWKPPYVPA